ncbi:BOS complex subunit ncln-like [Oscarella lobularis]|uniref:BOS complex subunit ncln-like n=1 Tax=Oscarella lobularis TaxID=121494 RepID=UPI0033136DB4
MYGIDEFLEICLLPALLFGAIRGVNGVHDFPAFRMQQFDLHGTQHGSRSAYINMEARPASAKMLNRRCVLILLVDLTMEKFRELTISGAGAIVVIVPKNLSQLSQDFLEEWMDLEREILEEEPVNIPVYFVYDDETVLKIYEEVSHAITADQASSAAAALLDVFSTYGYQVATSDISESKPKKDTLITSIQGKLIGRGIEDHLPTIAIVAHYDSFGIAPSLSFGADSNGSGVAALLELARLFSRLYADSRTQAQYNLLFFLSGGGAFNYQGTRKWIEDYEANEGILTDAKYVLCLDTIGGSNSLHLHVSKPPKDGIPASIVQVIKGILCAADLHEPPMNFTVVHKKINLANELLAWEHETFSMKRLPAGTISQKENSDAEGYSIFDKHVDVGVLKENTVVLAEGLAGLIFNLDVESFHLLGDEYSVSEEHVGAWVNYLSSFSRAAQLVGKDHPLLSSLEQTLAKHVKDVRRYQTKPDKKEPEFVFYDIAETKLYMYSVKPALFDLFLTAGIVCYLFVVFYAIQSFSTISNLVLLHYKPKTA